jgi:pyruvate-formate lyase-activating enzyme
VINAICAETERRAGRSVLRSSPFILHFEATNCCNLRCPYCDRTSSRYSMPRGMLRIDQFKTVVDQIRKTLVLVRLDGSGESFLNDDIYSMISYAAESGVSSAISTNLSTLKPDDFPRLVESGLDYLIISFDGATKDTYEGLRVGARYEDVVANIKEVVRARRSRRSALPFIELQFILFKENAHELPQMAAFADSLGVDRLLIKEARAERLCTVRRPRASVARGSPCYWLWYVLNVSWTGDLRTCCVGGFASPFSFGNIIERPVLAEWNNERMQAIRSLFTRNDERSMQLLEGCKCLSCHLLAQG